MLKNFKPKFSLRTVVKSSILASTITVTSCVDTTTLTKTEDSNSNIKTINNSSSVKDNIVKDAPKIRTPKNPDDHINSVKTVKPTNNSINTVKNATTQSSEEMFKNKPTASSTREEVSLYWKRLFLQCKIEGKLIDWQLTGPIKGGYKVFRQVGPIARHLRKDRHYVLFIADTRYETAISGKHSFTQCLVPFATSKEGKQEQHKIIVDAINRLEKLNN